MILHSFGRDFAPFDTIAAVFRTELARRAKEPIDFSEANLDYRRPANGKEERVFLEYLRARFDDAPPDVVVTIGAPAARFYQDHRSRLFPWALVVVDVSLAAGDVASLLGSIRRRAPEAKVVLLSVHDEPTVADTVFAAGADGLVFKRAIATDLMPAVDAVLAGRRYVSPTHPPARGSRPPA